MLVINLCEKQLYFSSLAVASYYNIVFCLEVLDYSIKGSIFDRRVLEKKQFWYIHWLSVNFGWIFQPLLSRKTCIKCLIVSFRPKKSKYSNQTIFCIMNNPNITDTFIKSIEAYAWFTTMGLIVLCRGGSIITLREGNTTVLNIILKR